MDQDRDSRAYSVWFGPSDRTLATGEQMMHGFDDESELLRRVLEQTSRNEAAGLNAAWQNTGNAVTGGHRLYCASATSGGSGSRR